LVLSVVRHGRTAWNAQRRFQGHADVPLDDTGREQARALAALLRDELFDHVVSSDLTRARETAEILLAGRELCLTSDAGWREMRFGSWEGLTWEEIAAANPALEHETQPRSYMPPGGETFDALCERVASAVRRVAEALPQGGRALVVTHAGPMHALLRVLEAVSEEEALRVRFEPLSLLRFSHAGERWRTENPLPGA
jgi:broad specificity phosphatase PhoE